jgi:hypothetical protein
VYIDPTNPNTLYLTGFYGINPGLVKSTDRGSTWFTVGTPPATYAYVDTQYYLDDPFQVSVDPANSQHMYATEMSTSGGKTQGFWVTTNGGAMWVKPQGFIDARNAANGSDDVGHMSVDPTDFNHVLVCSHYYWNNNGPSGIFETRDGGKTFIAHNPAPGMTSAGKGASFLYNPSRGMGNSNTWLCVEDWGNFYRTTDAGTTWTVVQSAVPGPHGGIVDRIYTTAGILYCGTSNGLVRSSDNGVSWTKVNAPSMMVYALCTDGVTIYVAGTANTSGWWTSPETDGNTWTQYGGTHPTGGGGISELRCDEVNRIVYSACNTDGVWALKIVGSGTAVSSVASPRDRTSARLIRTGIVSGRLTLSIAGSARFDIRGKTVDKNH